MEGSSTLTDVQTPQDEAMAQLSYPDPVGQTDGRNQIRNLYMNNLAKRNHQQDAPPPKAPQISWQSTMPYVIPALLLAILIFPPYPI